MRSLITDLLDYAKVDRNPQPLQFVAFEKVVVEAVERLKESITQSGAQILWEQLPTLKLDPSSMTLVFQNLLTNAIKYHGPGTPIISITAAKKGDHGWQFCVTDNGIGIDPQYFDRIFMMFQRLHPQSDYPGSGIGLPICKKIIERQGGKIWVESTPGKGSSFFFTLPDRL